MSRITLPALVLAAASLATPAVAGPLRDGQYDCATPMGSGIMAMGHMDIRGNAYRFRPYDHVTDDFAPYSSGGGDTLRWSGSVGGLTESPSVITESHITDYGFYIKYRTLPSGGYIETMSCRHMQ